MRRVNARRPDAAQWLYSADTVHSALHQMCVFQHDEKLKNPGRSRSFGCSCAFKAEYAFTGFFHAGIFGTGAASAHIIPPDVVSTVGVIMTLRPFNACCPVRVITPAAT